VRRPKSPKDCRAADPVLNETLGAILPCFYLSKLCYDNKCLFVINSLKPKLVQIKFKNSVRTAEKKAQLFTVTKINWLTQFKEIIEVYGDNYRKLIN
jgi:hypothetical protein